MSFISEYKRGVAVFFVSIMIFVAGCTTPDVGPFVEASETLSKAVRDGGKAAAEVYTSVPYKDRKTNLIIDPEDSNYPGNKIREEWDKRVIAMEGLVRYANSLQAIVGAGMSSRKNAEKFAKSVGGLVSYVPNVTAGAAEVESLTTLIIDTAINIKTYRDLSKAVEKAHPIFVHMAPLIIADLNDLYSVFRASADAAEVLLDAEYEEGNMHYYALKSQIKTERAGAEDPILDAGVTKLNGLYSVFTPVEKEYKEYERKLGELMSKRVQVESLLREASDTITSWVEAHGDLKRALKDKKNLDVGLLIVRTQEIRDAVEKLRNP